MGATLASSRRNFRAVTTRGEETDAPGLQPLGGRRVALTGGSRGIGFAIAKRLVQDGAKIAICAREITAVRRAVEALRALSPSPDHVMGTAADVTDTSALERFAEHACRHLNGIDSIVANAGIWGPKGAIDKISFDEWMHAFDVNVHGVVRVLRAFLPALRASGTGRIVIMAGGGAYQPYPYINAYGATKSAVVRLGEQIAEELAPEGIPVNMMLPGPVNTGMVDELLAAGPQMLGEKRYQKVVEQKRAGGTPPEKGAALCSFLLSDRIAGVTGKLISVADPYETFVLHRDEIMSSDALTLRRVVPSWLA